MSKLRNIGLFAVCLLFSALLLIARAGAEPTQEPIHKSALFFDVALAFKQKNEHASFSAQQPHIADTISAILSSCDADICLKPGASASSRRNPVGEFGAPRHLFDSEAVFLSRPSLEHLQALSPPGGARKDKKKNVPLPEGADCNGFFPICSANFNFGALFALPGTPRSVPGKRPNDPRASPGC